MTEGNHKKTVLENGLCIVTESNDYVRSAAIGIFIKSGARNETSDNHGVAHFLEHMVFKGTETKDSFEIANSLESIGGSLNAATSEEYTVFYSRILDEHMENAIEVLSDLVQNAVINSDVTKIEKGVIIEEIKGVEDTPSQLVVENFLSDLFPDHSLGKPILGTEESIKSMTAAKLKEYRKKNYIPENIVISAAGNLEHDKVVELVNEYFHIPGGQELPALTAPNGTLRNGINKVNTHITQSHICLGYRALPYTDKRRHAMLVMNTILSGGMSTRLFQNIREKYGFVYSIYSFPEFLFDTGYFCTYAGTDAQKTDEVIGLIEKEIKALKNEPVKIEEIESARAQWKGGALISMESMMSRMNRMAMLEMHFGEYSSIDELIKKIDSVRIEDVKDLANDIFVEGDMVVSVIQPEA
ncbi:MAG: insulinase family protein [Candidatus Marinimicrobia bacterium]|nr:insulinase family protein [Candidatus Neomarinimicrobiota bacterium]